ncbi:methyl-accepting chemotaxis protein [Marinobacter oulmenensis]|uniref:Methyl-accepting chemotaxis protein n=1 Tax=Marinobacter oulmenensis TaxID=643747 RepID=A0A840UM85_9GAMM|nr:PAS domain-containing methyl-accepting chemotaxis protein [Marinobacter oulmenensis]MBB5321957.1 methyl-accepting chemotaxis protein [Marinobacter oulmenensis]
MFGKKLHQENAALKEELYMLQQLSDEISQETMVLYLDAAGKITACNEMFQKEFGVSADELNGRHARDLVPEYDRNTQHFEHMMNALKEGRVWSGAWQAQNPGGSQFWLRVLICPIKTGNGKLSHFTLVVKNLTRTIEASREHDNLIRAMQRSTAVIEFDMDGYVLHANQLFLNAVGYSLNEVKGKHHRIFCPPEVYDSPEYEEFWARLKRGDFVADRFKRIGKHGDEVWLEASYNPLMNSRDQYYKVVKFATVITDQVRQEQEVSNAAGVAFETSKDTDASAVRGIEVMVKTAEVMQELSDQMNEAVAGMGKLDHQSQMIGNIIQSISGIADQTNLLALNAAIEAARAGEHGRGFAVVADEVRQLASRTTAATEEIVGVVNENQELTSNAVYTIESGKAKAEDVRALVHEANEVIHEIQEAARKVVDAVSQFSNQYGE